MNDDFLTSMRRPPRREFANELYERISEPMTERRPIYSVTLQRVVLGGAALAALLFLTLLVSPAARTFADEQFRQIGALIFRQEALDPATQATVQPTMPAPGDTDRPETTSLLDDASRLAGFRVLAPAYLPQGYLVKNVWSIDRRESGTYVVSSYRNETTDRFLLLNQILYAPGASFDQTIGDMEQISDVSVNGNEAVWIVGRQMTDPTDHTVDLQEMPTLYATNWLIWQAGDITYMLMGNDLDQGEMIRIAESIGN